MRYLVTTYADRLPQDCPILMVDGTVPGWVAKPGDYHWDHHRPAGSAIQIDEMPFPTQESLVQSDGMESACIVTTMVDADACCAAAWLQLPTSVLTPETVSRLRAIAWDCDHLHVPAPLEHLSEFAANAVAALTLQAPIIAQVLNLPEDRKIWTVEDWERLNSEQFRTGTEWLIAAVQGQRPYPGEGGEAALYWQELERDRHQLIQENRVVFFPTKKGEIAVCNLQDLDQSVDPKVFYQILDQELKTPRLRPETLILRRHRQGGRQYTLGCLPKHPETKDIDFTVNTFERLTTVERVKQPQSDPWGGRRTVGGSPWNTPSQLAIAAIVAILDT